MLSLGVKVGSKIYVDFKNIIRVVEIKSPNLILVKVDNGPVKVITDLTQEELLPQVFVQTGSIDGDNRNRLAFNAPRHIRIGTQTAEQVSNGHKP